MKYDDDDRPEFTDAKLTPRASNLALWLCDLANPALSIASREASSDLLLRELPDHWTAGDLATEARQIRTTLGPRASRCAWLRAMGWLVGEDERLPDRPSQRVSEATKHALQRRVRDLLVTLGAHA